MLPSPIVSVGTLSELANARQKVAELEDRASAEGLASVKLSKNDIIREIDTGARYRVERVSCYVHTGSRASLHIQAARIYKTGRREARSYTHISGSRYEREPLRVKLVAISNYNLENVSEYLIGELWDTESPEAWADAWNKVNCDTYFCRVLPANYELYKYDPND